MRREVKFRLPLKNIEGSASYNGEPSEETIKAVNAMAEKAYQMSLEEINDTADRMAPILEYMQEQQTVHPDQLVVITKKDFDTLTTYYNLDEATVRETVFENYPLTRFMEEAWIAGINSYGYEAKYQDTSLTEYLAKPITL